MPSPLRTPTWVVAALLSVACPTALARDAASPRWHQAAALPFPLAGHMSAFISADSVPRMLVVGGQRSPTAVMERTCLQYHPREDSWSELPRMRYARGHGSTALCRSRVYVMGGWQSPGAGLPHVEAFDPNTGTWAVAPDLPESLCHFSTAVWRDSLIYVIGGGSWMPGRAPTSHVWFLDPSRNIWRAALPLPEPLAASVAGISGDTIVVATGWTLAGPTNRVWRGVVDSLDPSVVLWREIDTLPGTRRYRCAGAGWQGRLIITGGVSLPGTAVDASSVLNETWLHDIAFADWRRLTDKPDPACDLAGAGAGELGLLYFTGGNPGVLPLLRSNDALDAAAREHDVGVAAINSPRGRIAPRTPCEVEATLANFGAATETLLCRCAVVETIAGQTVLSLDTVLVLAPDSSVAVRFGTVVAVPGQVLATRIVTVLHSDENPRNDTATALARTTMGSDPDGYGYVYESTQEPDTIIFAWVDTAGATVLGDWRPNADDGISYPVRRLPFSFPYYGQALTRLYVCTNGFLQTDENSPGGNTGLPAPDLANPVAPFWDDLTLRERGQVLELLTPEQAVYTWVDVPRYGDTGRLDFQVVLRPNGDIRFNYLNVTGDPAWCTAGIQGLDGAWRWFTEYVCDGRPGHHAPADSTSIRFRLSAGATAERAPGLATPHTAIASVARRRVDLPGCPGQTKLLIFDPSGRLVRTIDPSPHPAWDGRDASGRVAPAGPYFVLPAAGPGARPVRLLLLH